MIISLIIALFFCPSVVAMVAAELNEELLQIVSQADSACRIHELISAGAQLTAKTKDLHHTPLMVAAACGHVENIKALLCRGACVNDRLVDSVSNTEYGYTALMFAARYGHVAVGRQLLECGAHYPDTPFRECFIVKKITKPARSKTAINVATENGHNEFCKFLIENKADVNQKDYDEGFSPLNRALKLKNWDLCQMFLEAGAQVNLFDEVYDVESSPFVHGIRFLPLRHATLGGKAELCSALLTGAYTLPDISEDELSVKPICLFLLTLKRLQPHLTKDLRFKLITSIVSYRRLLGDMMIYRMQKRLPIPTELVECAYERIAERNYMRLQSVVKESVVDIELADEVRSIVAPEKLEQYYEHICGQSQEAIQTYLDKQKFFGQEHENQRIASQKKTMSSYIPVLRSFWENST